MINGLLRNYYRCLGEEVYRKHDGNFWKFHQKKLAELGYPLSKPRLAAAAAWFFLKFLISPKRVAASVRRRIGRASSSPPPGWAQAGDIDFHVDWDNVLVSMGLEADSGGVIAAPDDRRRSAT